MVQLAAKSSKSSKSSNDNGRFLYFAPNPNTLQSARKWARCISDYTSNRQRGSRSTSSIVHTESMNQKRRAQKRKTEPLQFYGQNQRKKTTVHRHGDSLEMKQNDDSSND